MEENESREWPVYIPVRFFCVRLFCPCIFYCDLFAWRLFCHTVQMTLARKVGRTTTEVNEEIQRQKWRRKQQMANKVKKIKS